MGRCKGTGSISRIGKQPKSRCREWRLQVKKDGTRRTRRFHGTYAQAEVALARFEAELDMPEPCELTFGEYAQRWHERRVASGDFAVQSMASELMYIRRLSHYFGGMKLAEINREDVQDGIAAIKSGDNPTGKELSGTTMNKTFAALRQIMGEAVVSDLIPKNPTDGLKKPKRDTQEKQAVPFEDVRRFLALLEALPLDGHTMALRLMVLAGVRRSECVGLEWRDVGGGMVRVRRSIVAMTGEVKATKSAAGVRSVPMLPQLAVSLDAWKIEQAMKLAALGIEQTPETPIVSSDTGTRMNAQNLYRWWSRNREQLGVHCTLHELRHTFLTMLANSGSSAQALKSIAGWSSIDMASVYVHDDEAANAEAVAALGGRFGAGVL